MRTGFHLAALLAGCLLNLAASAASIYVKALGYGTAEVVINRGEARIMFEGETSLEGVTLRSVAEDGAVFEINGTPWRLKTGEGTYSQTTLRGDARGQFLFNVQVNGATLPALIDTGATAVAINSEDALQIGIDYLRGRRVTAHTASGPASAYLVTFTRVQVGDIVLSNVPGTVIDVGKRELPLVLIGMSFLRHVDMQRSGNTMILLKRDY
jgi:aspartyl protease family protein